MFLKIKKNIYFYLFCIMTFSNTIYSMNALILGTSSILLVDPIIQREQDLQVRGVIQKEGPITWSEKQKLQEKMKAWSKSRSYIECIDDIVNKENREDRVADFDRKILKIPNYDNQGPVKKFLNNFLPNKKMQLFGFLRLFWYCSRNH